MLKSRRLYLLLVAIFTMAVFVACAPKEGSKDNVDDNSSNADIVEQQVINIYSSRHYDVDKEIHSEFEEKTGIKVNLVEGKGDEILERLTREGQNTEADIFMTVGAENLSILKEKDLIQEFSSDVINTNIPQEYRGNDWVGLTSRARVIVYNKERVNPSDIKTYSDLTKPEWKGKVLSRSSTSSYNNALLASFIQLNGEEEAKSWAEGIVNNFARDPEGNDRDQAKAIAAGVGDVGIMNSYYLVRMINSSDAEEANVAKEIGLIFPEDTHVNLSFGAITKSSKNKENAIKFLEFLTSKEVQEKYAKENGEFPLNQEVELPEIQASWGEFNKQKVDFEKLGENKQKATIIFDETGWK